MFSIDLTPFKPGNHELVLEPAAEDLDLPSDAFTEIKVTARIDYQPRRIVMRLSASAQACLECDRTLEQYAERVRGEHMVVFLPPEELPAEASELEEDLRALPDPGESIDLTVVTRDSLLLALPVRRVAPGAEDQELRLVFGGEEQEPTDPRWEALRRLRQKS